MADRIAAALGVSPLAFAALALIVALAAAIQRLAGQGFGTITAAFTALIAPQQVPAAILAMGLMTTLAGVGLDFKAVRGREIAPAVLGRLLGTLPAVWIVGAVAGSDAIGLAVGLVILGGVALSLAGLKAAKTPATLLAAGGLSGFMGTLTSVGAAPMGLIYQDEEAKAARGSLNLFFLLGIGFSLGGLAVAGLVEAAHLIFAAAMAPAIAAGVWLSAPLAHRMEGAPLKPLALALAGGAAVLLVGRSVL